jgi:hypothetical protein
MKPNLVRIPGDDDALAEAILVRAEDAFSRDFLASLQKSDYVALGRYGRRQATIALREGSAERLRDALLATAISTFWLESEIGHMLLNFEVHFIVAEKIGMSPTAVLEDMGKRIPESTASKACNLVARHGADLTSLWRLVQTADGPDFVPRARIAQLLNLLAEPSDIVTTLVLAGGLFVTISPLRTIGWWVLGISLPIAAAIRLKSLIGDLTRWGPLSWPKRCFTVSWIMFMLEIAIFILAELLHIMPLTVQHLAGPIILCTFLVAAYAFFMSQTSSLTTARTAQIAVPLAFLFLLVFPQFLVFLATNGNMDVLKVTIGEAKSFGQNSGWAPWLGLLFLASVPFLIIATPEVLRRKSADVDLSEIAKGSLPGVPAIVAGLATGSYILTLHYTQGPLARTPLDELLFAILAATILLGPFYRSIARACWEHGVDWVFNPRNWLLTPLATINLLRQAFSKPPKKSGSDGSVIEVPPSIDTPTQEVLAPGGVAEGQP